MRNNYITLFVFLLSICYVLPTNAFFDKDIHLLTMQDGLADNTVTSIYKDEDGFMWFATHDGISLYDGKKIRNFKPTPTYFSPSKIVRLSSDYLGIIAYKDIYFFNRKTETFTPVSLDSTIGELNSFFVLSQNDHSFWLASQHHLYLCQWEEMPQEGKIHIKKQKAYTLLKKGSEKINAICYDEKTQQHIWVTTTQGTLLLFSTETSLVEKAIDTHTQTLQVTSLLSKQDKIWISTIEKGIIRYDKATEQTDKITYNGNDSAHLLSHTDVYETLYLGNNRYLAATWCGYTLLTSDEGKISAEIHNHTHTPNYQYLETRMISAYYDPNGTLWIGTNGGGVFYSNLKSQFYQRFQQNRHNEICSILMDPDHYIWLATFHKGIMRSETPFKQGEKLHFKQINVPHKKTDETILCSLKDKHDHLWFGYKNGHLVQYDTSLKQFTLHPLKINNQINPHPIWALHMDSQQRLWIGTEQGLLCYDIHNKQCNSIPLEQLLQQKEPVWVTAITESKDGSLWLGTFQRGICKLELSPDHSMRITCNYEQKARIEKQSVRSLLASSDGHIYIGYYNGFSVLSPTQDQITAYYNINNGLCSNFIGCITEDAQGNIWLGSNSGISRYSRSQHLFYHYYISGSNRSALCAGEKLFFGNNQGITYFNPSDIEKWPTNERIVLTGLEVENHPVSIGEKINKQVLLKKIISHTDKLILNDENKDFSLLFSNLSFPSKQEKYNYRLLPYQKNWLVCKDEEKVSYTNLTDGNYVFEVRNIYPNGQTGPVTTLHIEILPHWSNTFLFKLAILLVIISLILYGFRIMKKRQRRIENEIKMKHELFTVNLEREKEHQIRIERENFFTYVAHELRTPLTLILAPLQELIHKKDFKEEDYSKLHTMFKNAHALNSLVDHLLYIQKIEAGMVKLQLSETNVTALVSQVAESFKQMAESRNIAFTIHLSHHEKLYWIDKIKMRTAIQNILSNAFKYTPQGGQITLTTEYIHKDEQGYYQIKISDTGSGIPEKLQEHIFDSFITGENTPEMSTQIGIGLHIVKHTMDLHHGLITLNSTPGKGSTFTLSIPEGKNHFAQDGYEIIEKQPATTAPKAATGNSDSKKMLIIEDNEEVQSYIYSLFCTKYEVYKADNGEEGIILAKKHLPDIIISDVMMPIKDGFTCCKEIRANHTTAHIPILMLTAKAEEADFIQGTKCGADDYMMKPFNPRILQTKVDHLIMQREQLKRIYTQSLMLNQTAEKNEKEDVFLQQLIRTIELHLANENFNVKMLAEEMNMSQPTLYRKIKQRSDLSVVDMIRSMRMSKAASLILEKQYSIQEISEMVGYSDARTLRKHFTEHFGVSPSKYIGETEK